MAVTTPKPKHVIRGSFRYTLRAFVTMANRLDALDERRPDLEILTTDQGASLESLVTVVEAKLEEMTS